MAGTRGGYTFDEGDIASIEDTKESSREREVGGSLTFIRFPVGRSPAGTTSLQLLVLRIHWKPDHLGTLCRKTRAQSHGTRRFLI